MFDNVIKTIKDLRELGFIINPGKSVIIRKQRITFLGFVISLKTVTLKLTNETIYKIKIFAETF